MGDNVPEGKYKKNIAVAGMGYWGKNLVRNFSELGALLSVCDKDMARQAVLREKYPEAEFVDDYGGVLEDERIQGVVLATPAATHYRMARAALEAGKDVYVEKPLALNVEEGGRLVEIAARYESVLMVGHILRYHAAVIKLDEIIRNGGLGRIRYIYSNRLSMGKIRTEENILWSFAPHDISVILALLGEEPCAVSCEGGSYLNENIPDVTMSQFVFPSGVRAHIHVSWLHPFKEQRLVVIGSEKMAVFDDTAEQKLVLYPHRIEWKNHIPTAVKAEAEVVPIELHEPLKAECAHFLDCIASRTRPTTDGEEGLRVLRILNECQNKLDHERLSCRTAQAPGTASAPADGRSADYFAHETAVVDPGAEIGAGTKIWHFSHIMKGARIGRDCIFGQNCNVDGGVKIGNNVKVQNNVSIYSGIEIEDDVFLGPSCVLTNVSNPRSQIKRHSLYEKTILRRGATIGANATIVCGVEIGRYAFVAAGAVVTSSAPDYALLAGNPAKQAGWMSRHGHWLRCKDDSGVMTCPESGFKYEETEPGVLKCLDLGEDEPLPEDMSIGEKSYDSFKVPSG